MSILIRGMDMPTSCGFCVFEQENGDGCECYVNGCLTEYQKRPDDCPLIHVPPHGRLADADALAKDGWYLNRYFSDSNGCWIENMTLEDAPTIIPADEPFGKSEQLNL